MLNISSLPALLAYPSVFVLLGPDEPCGRSPAQARSFLNSSRWPHAPVAPELLSDLVDAEASGVRKVCLASFSPDRLHPFMQGEEWTRENSRNIYAALGAALVLLFVSAQTILAPSLRIFLDVDVCPFVARAPDALQRRLGH